MDLSTLSKLKEWVTVPDAARCLSILLDNEVPEADVLRFALDGRLKLSIFFPKPTPAFFGSITSVEDVSDHLPGDRLWCCQEGEEHNAEAATFEDYVNNYYSWSSNEDTILIDKRGKQVLQVQSHCEIAGVFDLTMRGGERDYLENEYQRLIKSAKGELEHGITVETIPVVSEANQQGSAAFGLLPIPGHVFPKGTILVVRTRALEDFHKHVVPQTAIPNAKIDNADLKKRIEAVLAYARNYGFPAGTSHTQMAKKIIEQHKHQRFSLSALRQILAGRYGPMRRLGLNGLN